MKAIVLCGGLGTRLGELTRQTPKPMLEVAGRPFIAHVLDKLSMLDVNGFVLATGFHSDQVSDNIKTTWQDRPIHYSVEEQPLGTGGAIRLAMESFNLDQALVVNGDTLFDCDLRAMVDGFEVSPWATRMALRHVGDCARYGRVQIEGDGRVICFGEKGHAGPGLINAGIYVQRRAPLASYGAAPFSFETDYLAKLNPAWPIQGQVKDGYFIDMGIPEDLARARQDLMRR
jgi:D-glycero-alpha-D-manno-heptose 1-phosphate guanylyltransferase